MKLLEITNTDFFDHGNPQHKQFMDELDNYTASPDVALSEGLKDFLRQKYSTQTGSIILYRAIMVSDPSDFVKMFNIEQVVPGTKFLYRRSKESSWSKDKEVANDFAIDSGYASVVIEAAIPRKNFLFDTDELSANDRTMIILQDQREVIVDHVDIPALIINITK